MSEALGFIASILLAPIFLIGLILVCLVMMVSAVIPGPKKDDEIEH